MEQQTKRALEFKPLPRIAVGSSERRDENMCFYQDGGRGVVEKRKLFFRKRKIDPARVAMLDLVHGADVLVIGEDDLQSGVLDLNDPRKVDGMISCLPNTTLAVDVGDCPVILIWDDQQSMIGLAHGGWRSASGGLVDNLITTAASKTRKENINVRFGVGICGDCYRFLPESEHALLSREDWQGCRKDYSDGSSSFDIQAYLLDALVRNGVDRSKIERNNECTYHTKNELGEQKYFSHQKASQQGKTAQESEGRFIHYIRLES